MPCTNDGASCRSMTAEEHLKAAKELTAEKRKKERAKLRISKFLDSFTKRIKDFSGPCVFVLAETDDTNWRGVDLYKFKTGGKGAVLSKLKWWIGQCEPVPTKMTFDLVVKRGINWILSWHEHQDPLRKKKPKAAAAAVPAAKGE